MIDSMKTDHNWMKGAPTPHRKKKINEGAWWTTLVESLAHSPSSSHAPRFPHRLTCIWWHFSASLYIYLSDKPQVPIVPRWHSLTLTLQELLTNGIFFYSRFSSSSSATMYRRSKLLLLLIHPAFQDWQRLPSDLHRRDPWWGTCGPSRSQPAEQYLRPWSPSLAALCQVCTSTTTITTVYRLHCGRASE